MQQKSAGCIRINTDAAEFEKIKKKSPKTARFRVPENNKIQQNSTEFGLTRQDSAGVSAFRRDSAGSCKNQQPCVGDTTTGEEWTGFSRIPQDEAGFYSSTGFGRIQQGYIGFSKVQQQSTATLRRSQSEPRKSQPNSAEFKQMKQDSTVPQDSAGFSKIEYDSVKGSNIQREQQDSPTLNSIQQDAVQFSRTTRKQQSSKRLNRMQKYIKKKKSTNSQK